MTAMAVITSSHFMSCRVKESRLGANLITADHRLIAYRLFLFPLRRSSARKLGSSVLFESSRLIYRTRMNDDRLIPSDFGINIPKTPVALAAWLLDRGLSTDISEIIKGMCSTEFWRATPHKNLQFYLAIDIISLCLETNFFLEFYCALS